MLVIDPVHCTVERMGATGKLTKRQMAMFMFLYRHRNKVVTKGVLMEMLYGLENEDPDMKILDVFLCHIRRRLRDTGIDIQTVWGRGLRLHWDNNEPVTIVGTQIIDEVDA